MKKKIKLKTRDSSKNNKKTGIKNYAHAFVSNLHIAENPYFQFTSGLGVFPKSAHPVPEGIFM